MVDFIVNIFMKVDKYLLVFHCDKYKEYMELKGIGIKSFFFLMVEVI